MSDAWQIAVEYHERTKHHFQRYARALGYLDWATQPDPFRRYEGAPLHALLLSEHSSGPSYDDLFQPGAIPGQPVNVKSISALFEFSLALSAWKQYKDTRWPLRINPSSGNLHPTEGYLISGPISLHDQPAVYHYAPKEHALERRTEFTLEVWQQLILPPPSTQAADQLPPFTRGDTGGSPAGPGEGMLLVALTSIHWREAWKYGERAYRYCQHDTGHAIAAIALSAALQGWRCFCLSALSDDELASLLGLRRDAGHAAAEREAPDVLMAIVTDQHPGDCNITLDTAAIAAIANGQWLGTANQLSSDHVHWEAIDLAEAACAKSGPPLPPAEGLGVRAFGPPLSRTARAAPARQIIYQRRSALAFDGKTSLTAEQFFLMMDRVLPRWNCPPWQTLGPPVCIHLALFVHLVEQLVPGLYFLVRQPDKLGDLRRSMHEDFRWTRPANCPQHIPLYLLTTGDARQVAGQISCGQDIAADGSFSLGMIAEFEEPLREHGAWFYRRLHWEAGALGQVLYLEAEAAGIRATGIGCFFDDPMHDLLGLKGRRYQTLYHFTVGGHVEDTRLTSLPAYPPQLALRRQATP